MRWILCRNCDEFPIGDDLELQRFTERGGVRRDDYLLDQELDVCVPAGEITALKGAFRKAAVHRVDRLSHLLGMAMAFLWRIPASERPAATTRSRNTSNTAARIAS